MLPQDAIAEAITAATGTGFRIESTRAVSGGCINSAAVVSGAGQDYFVKLNRHALLWMFEAEYEGLVALGAANGPRVPTPLVSGSDGKTAFLVLEYLQFGSGRGSGARLGEQMARMHEDRGARFGWHRENTIGSTRQVNHYADSWIDFLREHRLGFQFALARDNGHGGELQRLGERLLVDLGKLFDGYAPWPSLLHGDLWGGNVATGADGAPIIFDPATYYGDREADIAMTELFGGFSADFYSAYEASLPLDPGYPQRKTLYNLYHILNHLNIFGGSYHGQALGMTRQLVSQLG